MTEDSKPGPLQPHWGVTSINSGTMVLGMRVGSAGATVIMAGCEREDEEARAEDGIL